MERNADKEKVGHGVVIHRHGAEAAVVVPVSFGPDEDQSAATVLSRAWAVLAEAIAEHKLKAQGIEGMGSSGSGPAPQGGAPHLPPGSGAWWLV